MSKLNQREWTSNKCSQSVSGEPEINSAECVHIPSLSKKDLGWLIIGKLSGELGVSFFFFFFPPVIKPNF